MNYIYLSKVIDEKNKLYYFEPKDQLSSLEVRKFNNETYKNQIRTIKAANKLKGIKDIKNYKVNSNDLNLWIFEATYFHRIPKEKKAWTKIFAVGVKIGRAHV